jgi:hypothetical protein
VKKTIILLLFINLSVQAQDLVLKQFYQNPLTLGPQMGCSVKDQINAGSHLWGTEGYNTLYQNYFIGFNKVLIQHKTQSLAIQPMVSLDRAGESKFGTKSFGLGLSTGILLHKSEKLTHHLGAGIQLAYAVRSIDETGLRWPSQIGPGGFDPGKPGVTVFDFSFLDLTAGVNYKLEWGSNQIMVGYRLGHATRPRISNLSQTEPYRLDYAHTLYAMLNFKLTEKLGIRPKALYFQTGSQNTWNAGLDAAVSIGKGITVFAGGGKIKNGIFVNGGMGFGKWQWLILRERYDGNLFKGWELGLNYKI